MLRRAFIRSAAFVAALCLFLTLLPLAAQSSGSSGRGRKYQAPPPSATIRVTVLRDSDGKPLENVAVIFHPLEGERDHGIMELKTNEDGKAVIDVIPIGDTIRMQVFGKGYQTYGEEYKVDKAEISKEVRLKRPSGQYSIYKNNTGGKQESGPEKGQTPDSSGGGQSGPGTGKEATPPSK